MFTLKLSNSKEEVIVDEDIYNKYKDTTLKLDCRGLYVIIPDMYYVFLHRYIMKSQRGQEVDHINRNKFDCRRENLRFCSRSTNLRNRVFKNKYGFRGVSKVGKNQKNPYMATIWIDNNRMNLGCFPTPEAAGEAYQIALKHHRPNDIQTPM